MTKYVPLQRKGLSRYCTLLTSQLLEQMTNEDGRGTTVPRLYLRSVREVLKRRRVDPRIRPCLSDAVKMGGYAEQRGGHLRVMTPRPLRRHRYRD